MTVVIDGEELTFTVGAEFAKSPLGVELALFGELETQRPWQSPFGIDWLTVNGLTLQPSLDPVGTVGLGFAGDIVIGSKDLRAAIGVEISAAGVPTNLILRAESDEGVSTADLLVLQQLMTNPDGTGTAIDASRYPTLELRNIDLLFAPQASERLGVEAGFAVAGDAYVSFAGGAPQRFAFLDVSVNERGLFASGELSAFSLGPLSWTDITLDLELSENSQHFSFDGSLTILTTTFDLSIDLSTDSIIMNRREALEDLEAIIDGIERVLRDPAGSAAEIPELFARAGVPLDPWMEDLFAQMSDLIGQGQELGEATIDVILNGGAIPLVVSPVGGNDPVCPITAPIPDGGRCYLALAIVSNNGVPAGGSSPKCQLPYLSESGGRCYTTCENLTGTKTKSKTVTNIAGIPSGGRAKSCGILSPTEEDGRCYTISPSQAERGIGVQGLCKVYAEVECSLDDLVSGAILEAIIDQLVSRLSGW